MYLKKIDSARYPTIFFVYLPQKYNYLNYVNR